MLLLFYILVFWPWGMWDLRSLMRDWNLTPCIGRWRLNHWTARQVPKIMSWRIIFFFPFYPPPWGFPGGACGKEPACQCRSCKIPGLGRSPGGGPGNPLQYSCLENPIDRGAWRATVHRVTQSRTWMNQLSTHPPLWCQHWNHSKVRRLCEWSSLQGCRKVHLGNVKWSWCLFSL